MASGAIALTSPRGASGRGPKGGLIYDLPTGRAQPRTRWDFGRWTDSGRAGGGGRQGAKKWRHARSGTLEFAATRGGRKAGGGGASIDAWRVTRCYRQVELSELLCCCCQGLDSGLRRVGVFLFFAFLLFKEQNGQEIREHGRDAALQCNCPWGERSRVGRIGTGRQEKEEEEREGERE